MHDHGRSHSARLLGKLSLPATMSSATFLAELATWGRLANWATTPIHPGYQGIYAQAGASLALIAGRKTTIVTSFCQGHRLNSRPDT